MVQDGQEKIERFRVGDFLKKLTRFPLCCRTKLLLCDQHVDLAESTTLVMDALYLSLCIELAFDGSREVLVAVLGVAYVAGGLLAR